MSSQIADSNGDRNFKPNCLNSLDFAAQIDDSTFIIEKHEPLENRQKKNKGIMKNSSRELFT